SYIIAKQKTFSTYEALCEKTCGSSPKPWACEGSAELKGVPTSIDPDGDEFVGAACKCEVPLANEIADLVMEALPIIGDALEAVFGTTCAIILNIIAEVVQDVALPEGKALTVGWRVLIEGAKTFKDNELGALDYQNWISSACGGGTWVDNVNEAFDFLGGERPRSTAFMNGYEGASSWTYNCIHSIDAYEA
ncbi:hypothetical protein GGR57DRAFT_516779, partial [Xylariaceae sp. FL1272]